MTRPLQTISAPRVEFAVLITSETTTVRNSGRTCMVLILPRNRTAMTAILPSKSPLRDLVLPRRRRSLHSGLRSHQPAYSKFESNMRIARPDFFHALPPAHKSKRERVKPRPSKPDEVWSTRSIFQHADPVECFLVRFVLAVDC